MANGDRILVFAKPAVPGEVKTRLIPPFTPEEAAEFHLAALDDVVRLARDVARPLELWVAGGASARAPFRRRYPRLRVRSQGAGDLGERLRRALATSFREGVRRALVVGSDHPTLPAGRLAAAFRELERADVVFGPSSDGGYYLIAVRGGAWPEAETVLRDIPWSTDGVLRISLERARDAGLEVALLPEWYDVDRPADLERLRRDASPESHAGRFLAGRGRDHEGK